MDAHDSRRRIFIKTSAAAVAAMALPSSSRGADQSASQKPLPIGCHARPFGRFRLSHDDLLDAIKAAGYASADMISADKWEHSYSRAQAAFPAQWLHDHTFWPAVGRIDNVYGDRNLVCSCAGMEAYV